MAGRLGQDGLETEEGSSAVARRFILNLLERPLKQLLLGRGIQALRRVRHLVKVGVAPECLSNVKDGDALVHIVVVLELIRVPVQGQDGVVVLLRYRCTGSIPLAAGLSFDGFGPMGSVEVAAHAGGVDSSSGVDRESLGAGLHAAVYLNLTALVGFEDSMGKGRGDGGGGQEREKGRERGRETQDSLSFVAAKQPAESRGRLAGCVPVPSFTREEERWYLHDIRLVIRGGGRSGGRGHRHCGWGRETETSVRVGETM